MIRLLKTAKPRQPAQLPKLPKQAKTLRLIADSYGEAFYRGEIAVAIDEFSRSTGGYIRKSDLAAYPCRMGRANQHLITVVTAYGELPPNGHGIVALMALNILKGFEHSCKDCDETCITK